MAVVNQHLRVKGLDLITSVDSALLDSWIEQVAEWETLNRNIAMDAIDEIKTGIDFYAVTDDQTNELVAICSFEKKDKIDKWLIHDGDEDYFKNGYIYVGFLAGIGKGGAREIIKDIMQIGEIDRIPLYLESTKEAEAFYKKMGFKESRLKGYYYYIPKGLRV